MPDILTVRMYLLEKGGKNVLEEMENCVKKRNERKDEAGYWKEVTK